MRDERIVSGRTLSHPVSNEVMMGLWRSVIRTGKKMDDTLKTSQRNRIAGAALDKAARDIFAHLDRETSLKWEDLTQITNTMWPDAARAAALLVWANLCQPGPTRIRLTETGISILNESASTNVG